MLPQFCVLESVLLMMPADPSNVERAVSRTLRDSLERLQRNAKELDQAVADFVAACASNRPANALPSMLRAQTASASLSATLEVLSRFVTTALQPAHRPPDARFEQSEFAALEVEAPEKIEAAAISAEPVTEPAAAAPEVNAEAAEPQAAESPVVLEAYEPQEAPAIPEALPIEFAEPEVHAAETPLVEAHTLATEEADSLAVEVRPDPALEPHHEPVLSPGISAMPAPLEPLANWAPPQQPVEADSVEPVAAEVQHDEPVAAAPETSGHAAEGIVDEPAYTLDADPTPDPEESTIIEEAIAGGIAKLSEFDPAALDAASANGAASEEPELIGVEFDIALLPADERELHRRASRVAKVSMQDIKLLRPQEVAIGRENKDLCIRLHEEIERAHKEYGRRFKPIMNHPVDYFYDWMVEILAAGDPSALGPYPYETQSLRR
jgi:hypothetical protein